MFTYCSECKYWVPNEIAIDFGQCRRKAPLPTKQISDGFIGAYNNRAIWMYTRVNDGCGEGETGKRTLLLDEVADQTLKLETKSQFSAFDRAVQKARKEMK